MIRILGICGSPVKDSNTEVLLREGLKAIEQDGVQTDIFLADGKKIEDCRQCNWCMGKQTEGRYCAVSDPLDDLYPKVLEADGLLVASPVYLARLSGHMASVLDRLRCLMHGKIYGGRLKHKVGAAIAVAWFRNSGIETTLSSIHWAFLTYQIIIAAPGPISTWGGSGLSSRFSFAGESDVKGDARDKHQVLHDTYGLKTVRETAKSLVDLTRIIKAGKEKTAIRP